MNYDIVIIGAGIIGLNTALQLSKRTSASILVLEKSNSLGTGSTGASSAICRHRYSLDETVLLAKHGIETYRNWQEYLGQEKVTATFHDDGVLWLTGADDGWPAQEVDRLAGFGIGAEVLAPDEIRHRFPAINPCSIPPDIETGEEHVCNEGVPALFETTGGYFDPAYALDDLKAALTNSNVTIQFNADVTNISTEGSRVTGVKLSNGDTINTAVLVNASGPWCNFLLSQLDMASRWDLTPTRIQVIHLDRPDSVKGHIPVCADLVGGVYFRTQNRGQQLVVGSTREEDERESINPDDLPTYVDEDFKVARLHALHHRLPDLPYAGRIQGYCGLYTFNHIDVHPIVGRTPVEGFFVANGFSGHGFKLAPAIASLLAQDITGETLASDTAVSTDFLKFDRDPLTLDAKTVLA